MGTLDLIQRPRGNYDLLDNTGYDFPFKNKGAVMPLGDVDRDIGDVDRDIDRTADTSTGSLLNIPPTLARLQASGSQRTDIPETLPVHGDR